MKGIKRFISLLLAVALVSGVMPVGGFSAHAADGSITYKFYTASGGGHSDVTGTSLESYSGVKSYTDYPSEGSGSDRAWAYLGTSVYKSLNANDFVNIHSSLYYVGTAIAQNGEWLAFKIKVPKTAGYGVSGKAYFYKNSTSSLDIYILPMTSEFEEKFRYDNKTTYGTVTEDTDATDADADTMSDRTGAKALAELGVFDAYKVGNVNIKDSSAKTVKEFDASALKGVKLEAGEYILIFRAVNGGAITPAELTLTETPVAATPGSTLSSGTYTTAQTTTLSCATGSAKIYYTTDGTEPTASSTEYTGAIEITRTTTLKAVAVCDGYIDSDIAEFNYTIGMPEGVDPQVTTKEEREIIRENIATYKEWAKPKADALENRAKTYVDNYEKIYDLIVGEGLPRFHMIGRDADVSTDEANPGKCHVCLACGENIQSLYGNYAWKTDALDNSWKVQCPNCEKWFPSNNFAEFYKLGLQDDGTFDRMKALEAHHDKCGYQPSWLENLTGTYNNLEEGSDKWYKYYGYGDERGYLYNESFTDEDARYAVDDGLGYKNGETFGTEANPQDRHYAYIAYYLLEGLWHGSQEDKDGKGLVSTAIKTLADAYIYTGDIKYARAGIPLLDRVADIYPDMDWYRWKDFRHDNVDGKILDRIWSCDLAEDLAYAYDAFLPAYGDEEVIDFLSGKDPSKNNETALRKNVENNILRETYNNACDGKVYGNFGKHQSAVATAALALNNGTETDTWIDWIMDYDDPATDIAPGTEGEHEGGNVGYKLVNNVDRDGNGDEAASGYNGGWVDEMIEVAELLSTYKPGDSNLNLYANPKFVKMFSAQIPLIMANSYVAQIGDSGATGSTGISAIKMETLKQGYLHTKDYRLAQLIYRINGNTTSGLRYDIGVEDPESLASEVQKVIDTYGELKLGSTMSAGYGFAALRDWDVSGKESDFGLYFGSRTNHGHEDALNLFISAYGLNMAPDLGYPTQTSDDPERIQWTQSVLSHNTVMVNGQTQAKDAVRGTPLHFDDSGKVKLMDVDATKAYSNVEDVKTYRRTLVMVDAGDGVSYGVDFFRIKGGNDHIYSFHSQSEEIAETDGVALTAQSGGTYAGKDVPYGNDADGNYPLGFTWLENVSRDTAPSQNFSVDFKVKDFWNVVSEEGQERGLHLRMTMVNPFELTELATADGTVPVRAGKPADLNTLKYVLARRTGTNLDSLYTTVFEPYEDNRYIQSIEPATLTKENEGTGEDKIAHAVKVTHKDGRVDYIVYANDNTTLYRVDDKFNFRGFVGVYSLDANGNNVYSYVNDGDVIGKYDSFVSGYTGYVSDFTKNLSLENSITITTSDEVDTASLAGKYVYVENKDDIHNGAYKIESATKNANTLKLDIGEVSLIRSSNAEVATFEYNISEDQKVTIPLSTEVEVPEFETASSEAFGERNGFIRNMLENDGTYSLYLFAGIDSLKYLKAGFRVTHDGETKDFATTDVYSKVTDDNGDILPEQFGGNSSYIFAIKLLGFSGFEKNKPVFFQPFAIMYDESRVYGKATEVKQIYKTGVVNNE